MTQLNLRIGNKLLGKKLITGLVPLLGRYNEARKSLRGSISQQSRQGLDWMNFFLADVQTAFGAFVAFYLADLGWSKGQVGLALTVGTLAGVISQIPGGALADAVRWKRGLAAIGIGMLCVSALILGLMPSLPMKLTMPEPVMRERASRPRATIASSTLAKTANYTSFASAVPI